MRTENLTTVKGGLNRLRTKGAALKDSLYDLLNGYVTAEKTVQVRPGTTLSATLPAGTLGLVHFDGGFHVFASDIIGGLPAGYTLHVLHSPTGADLTKIHFAEPFLGSLYVAAEFEGGDIFHFWLQDGETWAANTIYSANALVVPTTGNGFNYRATRLGDPYPVWTADAPRAVGDRIEPTTFNGLYFEVEVADGDNPRSGSVEPDFNVSPGDLVVEFVDGDPATTPSTPNRFPPVGVDAENLSGHTGAAGTTPRRYLR